MPIIRPRALLTFSLLATAALSSCGQNSEATTEASGPEISAPEIPLVKCEALAMHKVRRTIETTSYLESEHRVAVLSKISGRIEKILVDEGVQVTQGQTLAVLDTREADTAKRQVAVQLEDSKVMLELQKLEYEASIIRITQRRIDRDQAAAQYKRNAEIDPGLIAIKELEDSKFALDGAEETLRVESFNSRKAKLDVKTAENKIAEIEAKLEEQELKLAEHKILAPFDGIIEKRHAERGQTISSATELFTVTDPKNLITYLRRPQRELPLVRKAKQVQFTADAWEGRSFEAEIDVISAVVDETNGSFGVRVRVRVEDAEDLRPGMFIRATILTEDEREALMIPKAAIINEGSRSIVFAVRDQVAYRVVLETGLEELDSIECLNLGEEGLAAGDLIVISGQQDLDDKAAVEISEN